MKRAFVGLVSLVLLVPYLSTQAKAAPLSAAERAAQAVRPAALRPHVAPPREVASMRTATSDTYVEDGHYVTTVHQVQDPINYKDG